MMKKISILTAIIATLLTGCLKDSPNVDFSQIKPTVEIINSGLGYFANAAVLFPSDTVTLPIVINLASVDRLNKDVTVTLAIDNDALTAYNSTSTTQYEPMDNSSYSFPSTTATIPAGKRLDTVYVSFYGHTFDPSKSYMLPISISDASGVDLSGNFNTIYFHVIGNPIAGTYEEIWTRYNASDTTSGPPAYDHLDVGPVTFSPVSPTEISVRSEGSGELDFISFTNDGGNLTDFTAAIDKDDAANNVGITITSDPILKTNADHTYYWFYFTYNNSSGSPRVIINEYYKQ